MDMVGSSEQKVNKQLFFLGSNEVTKETLFYICYSTQPSKMVDDTRANAYSPEGRIYQIEYAMKAMNHGVTTVALTSKNTIVVSSEKKIISKLQVASSNTKHYKIDDRIGLAFSGISADASVIVEKSRLHMANKMMEYDECCSVVGMLKSLCSQSLKFGERNPQKKIFSRPFGASVLIAAFDECPKLFLLEPSGSYKRFKAKAIGSAFQAVDSELEKNYNEDMSDENAILFSYKLLKDVMKDKISKTNIETMIVSNDGVRFLCEDEIGNYLTLVE